MAVLGVGGLKEVMSPMGRWNLGGETAVGVFLMRTCQKEGGGRQTMGGKEGLSGVGKADLGQILRARRTGLPLSIK